VPGEDELLSHYRSTIGCWFIRQWYMASAKPRRRADKTSGRKRPRAGDIDIVPAGDVATALTATITANQQQQQQPPSPTPADVEPSSPPAPSSPTPTFRQATQDDATKALGPSRGSSTGYSVTPAANGCTTSARALDALHPLYLCA